MITLLRMDHPKGERPSPDPVPDVWTGRATNRFQWALAAVGAACVALGVGLAVELSWASGAAALLMAVTGCVAAGLLVLFGTLAFVHVEITVDPHALEVRCGHMGVPRRRIPLDTVVGADFAPSVTPCQWGGWGYRWLPEKGTAVVVRRGEGVVLTLHDGRSFTFTVDDAEAAVRVIRHRLRPGGQKRAAVEDDADPGQEGAAPEYPGPGNAGPGHAPLPGRPGATGPRP
ncbi:lipoprotein [Streptomyces gobitricini]|uniref:Lipoprotein n=1 Tax=Streptomyces gobitricini TaxID=68211 RepID=A0ABN3MTH8_9ACTN